MKDERVTGLPSWSGSVKSGADAPVSSMRLTVPGAFAESLDTVRAVLIAVLLFSELTVDKLAAHSIGPEEVRQVSDGDRIVIVNPRPRVEGSVLMIGPTYGGRVLTVVLDPDKLDDGTWHVRTAWPASPAQIGRYRRDR